jgi:hypothetical protein
MDLLKKVELLLSAKSRAILPRRERWSALDQHEEEVLAEIRRALGEVEVQERKLAERIKTELAAADVAAQQGDAEAQRAHERRAAELDRYLEQESVKALDLEGKLAALEEKLALAKEAVEKQAREVASRDAEASKVLSQGGFSMAEPTSPSTSQAPASAPADKETDLGARKSRLSK